ncbi:hypothetical protein BDFB_014521 [Asbolus verrucosus]|uniref:Peptidase M10 domain containing protein n=1 Tax=Asbolus verrucosus TaxID=1661398 RepID=A0A482VPA8_ASBVE|nr:hypothetical protein BDFB_014521 [Asbolus verrucosus]
MSQLFAYLASTCDGNTDYLEQFGYLESNDSLLIKTTTNQIKEVAQKAFDQWQSVSNLKFEYDSKKPGIFLFHFLVHHSNMIIMSKRNML